MENTQKKSSGKISYTLQIIGLLPLLALGIAMLFFTSQWFTKTMYQEVERELYDATKSATTLLNAAYPGDYHLELATSHMQASREVSALLTEMGFVPHSVRRSGSSVIYFKQSEHIEDLLTTIGAPAAAMDIMTAKVDKEIRNGANRAMNCDMANVNKTVDAALEQTAAISRLAESGRLALLPEKLRQAAQLRLDNPEMSLQQLAERSDPPVSKSCMNHRMRRLMEEARESHE